MPRSEEEKVEGLHGRADVPCGPWRAYAGTGGRRRRKEQQRYVLAVAPIPSCLCTLVALLKGLAVSCSGTRQEERSLE